MSDAQRHTIAKYKSFVHAHAISGALRAAERVGILAALRDGQKESSELASTCDLDQFAIEQLLRVLVSIGYLERYGEWYALSQAATLITREDLDLGEQIYANLGSFVRDPDSTGDTVDYRRRITTRQWTNTGGALQLASVLEIGTTRKGCRVLELGGGAGVWTAAMAYRDPSVRITLVDHPAMLATAKETFESVERADCLQLIESDFRTWDVPLGEFDLVVLPETVQLETDHGAILLLGRSTDALRIGGEVAIVENVLDDQSTTISSASHALEVSVASRGGRSRTVPELERLCRGAGLSEIRWSSLSAAPGIGLIIARKLAT